MVARLKTPIVLALVAACAALCASSAGAAVKFQRIDGYDDPATPNELDKVGILKVGPKKAHERPRPQPGHVGERRLLRAAREDRSSSRPTGWQVWAVERRENLLEDHSVLDQAKAGDGRRRSSSSTTTSAGSTDPSITDHFQLIPDADVAFARELGDERRDRGSARVVVKAARSAAARSSSAATRSAARSRPPTRPGTSTASRAPRGSRASSSSTAAAARPRSPRSRRTSVARQRSRRGSPWLTFGGIPAPFAGLFNVDGLDRARCSTRLAVARCRPGRCCPPNLKPPVPVDQPGAVRLRARHRDLAAEPRRRAGAPRPPRRERRSARLGPGRRDHADPALRRHVLRAPGCRASTAPPGTTRSA